MGALYHVVYTSRASDDFDESTIQELLENAVNHNQSAELTGMLLYCDKHFFQVLEGRKDTINTLYTRIEADTRHSNVLKLIEEPIEARAFGDWSMGYTQATTAELAEIEGLNDFFAAGKCMADIDSGRAKDLVRAFHSGKWR